MKKRSRRGDMPHRYPVAPKVRRMCGTMEVHNRLLESDPAFRARQSELEHSTSRMMMAAFKVQRVKIGVVVHVVHKIASENISDAQVKSQIKALNRDYRKLNPDASSTPAPWTGLVADCGIEFKLVQIVRKATTKAGFGTDDAVKRNATGGSSPVQPKKYLNIWVCSLGGGLLGYAQFPGGAAATDGVVILNTGFGTMGTAAAPFNKGRTATHEIGHWLNLRHIWGDDMQACSGSDLVADTPNAAGPNYGTPTFPSVTCSNGPTGDMFMNYMDYVDDKAMFMFTNGQSARMHAALLGPRAAYAL